MLAHGFARLRCGTCAFERLGQELADEDGVMRAEAAGQGVAQGGQLAAECAAGEMREDLGTGSAGDQGLEHGPAGDPEEAAGDRGELDPGIFEDLVEAGGVAGALLAEDRAGSGLSPIQL